MLSLLCAPACLAARMRSEQASTVIWAEQACMVYAERTLISAQVMYEIVWLSRF